MIIESDTESDSDREGERFNYDDDKIIFYPQVTRRIYNKNNASIIINNYIYISYHLQDVNYHIKIGFTALKEYSQINTYNEPDSCLYVMCYLCLIIIAHIYFNYISSFFISRTLFRI
jgi:hypothetical protein